MASDAPAATGVAPNTTDAPHIQADPTLKEQFAGIGKKVRGQMTGNEELKHQGERILDGTDAPSTKKKIEEVTGQSASQVNIQTQS